MIRSLLSVVGLFWISVSFGQSYSFSNVNLQGMGFVTGIIAHPAEKDVLFCRTDVGGIYRYDVSEKKWEPVTDGKITSYGIEAISMDPSNADSIYAAVDGKIYQSVNRGNDWTAMANTPLIKMNGNGQFRFSGKRMMIDPNNNDSVFFLVTRENGLQKSSNKGQTWKGISSTKLPFGNQTTLGYYGQTFVAIDKTSGNGSANSSLVYVGVQGMGVYKSEDGGENWALISGGPDVTYKPVCGVVSSDGSLYVSYSTAKDEWAGGSGKIYKYTAISGMSDITPANNNGLGFIGLDVDINNPSRVIAIQWKYGNINGIHYSEDAGATWKQKPFSSVVQPKWYPSWVAWGYTGQIMFDPFNAKKVWITNGFGVYVSDDITLTSTKWYTEMNGIEEFVVGQVHCPPVVNSSDVYSLQMDQIAFQIEYRDEVPGSILFPDDYGIGTGLDYCAADPNVIAIVGSDQNVGTTSKNKFTTNGGITWQAFKSIPLAADNGNIAISAKNSSNWVWVPRHQDGPKTMPHYTLDQGDTWQKSTGIPNVDNAATHLWAISSYLQSDKVDGNRFYYYMVNDGLSSGVIYRSDNSGSSFTKVFTGLPSNYKCKLKAMPGKSGNLFFYVDGGDLYRTITGGDSFVKASGISAVNGIGFGKAIAPSEETTIFLAATLNGKAGVYRSTDDAKTWTEISASNIPLPIIADISGDLRYENIVYLATGGRGIIYGTDTLIVKVSATGIQLSDSEVMLGLNRTLQLSATVLPEKVSFPRYSWKSQDIRIATVTNGLVTAKKIGRTGIIVTSKEGSFTDTCYIKVLSTLDSKPGNANVIRIFPNPINLKDNPILTIDGIDFRSAHVSVADLEGKIIHEKRFPSLSGERIELALPNSLPAGIYLVYLNSNRITHHIKLLVE